MIFFIFALLSFIFQTYICTMMNLDLTGKHAIVCGSTQGIGKAIALGLAEMGADVTLVARNANKLKEVKYQASILKNKYSTNSGTENNNIKELCSILIVLRWG